MSTARRYVWKRRDGKSVTKPYGLTTLRVVAAARIVWGKGPYDIKEDGNFVGKNLVKPDAVKRFISLISHQEIGSTFRVWDGHGTIRLEARAVKVNVLPTDSTSGNRNADAYYNWVVTKFKQFKPRYAGAYVCKSVSGTSTPSQHSYGNAVDFFFDSFAHQEAVANAVVASATSLRAYHVISGNRIWTKGQGWHAYTGEYHSHLHVDFDPQLFGSCGVRN